MVRPEIAIEMAQHHSDDALTDRETDQRTDDGVCQSGDLGSWIGRDASEKKEIAEADYSNEKLFAYI